MRSIGGLSLLFVATTILCCSSSDDAPGAPTPDDGGTHPDTEPTTDAGSDVVTTTASADFVNGSRLHAEVYEAGGVQLFVRFHDTKLDVPCEFARAEDGKLRCVPQLEDSIDPTKFSAGSCDGQRVYLRPPLCSASVPKMAPLGYSLDCGVGPPIYRIGSVTDASMIWVKNGLGCDPVQASATGSDIYAVGEKLDASEFVEGTFEEAPIGDGLGVRRVKGSDGSSLIWSAWDVARMTPCRRGGEMGGTPQDRCVPKNLAFEEGLFSDMGCSQLVAVGFKAAIDCTTKPAAILREGKPDACGKYSATYNELGASVTTPFFRMSPTCADANVTLDEGTSYWSLGPDLPLSALPKIVDKDEGAGPLKLRALASSSGARIIGRVLVDTAKNFECIIMRAADGEVRCLPPAITGTQVDYFSDTECKKPLILAPNGCAAPAYAHLMNPDPTTCLGPKTRYFSVGAKVTPAKVYANFHGPDCLEQAMPAGDLYDAATEIAPSDFVPVLKKTL